MIRPAIALTAVIGLTLAPTSATSARPAAKAHARADWMHTFAATPEGGFRMGNPAAPVKLVEYGSLACPHCRHFEETGYQPLVERYVRSGQVSYEFRNLILNGPDLAIALLTRCSGPGNFFPMSVVVYTTQPEWEKKFAGLSSAEQAELDKMTDEQRIVRFAQIGDLTQISAKFGMTPARAHQCLTDPKGLKRLLDMVQVADKAGINHTPTFLINGKVTNAATWEQLEPLLKNAGAHG
jgi:protein-disulfide isomerase